MTLFDPTKPYCRRDGKPAKIIYELPTTWVVITETYDGAEMLLVAYKPTGKALPIGNGENNNYDLINIPEKIEGWVNIAQVFKSKDEADAWVNDLGVYRSACIKVSFTEGEGIL